MSITPEQHNAQQDELQADERLYRSGTSFGWILLWSAVAWAVPVAIVAILIHVL